MTLHNTADESISRTKHGDFQILNSGENHLVVLIKLPFQERCGPTPISVIYAPPKELGD